MFEDSQRKEGKFTHVSIFVHIFMYSSLHLSYLWLTIVPAGKPISHQFAKEVLVGLAGAEVDKLAETKGMDFIDREKAKHHARENVQNMYDQHYIQNQGADQYDP